MDWFLRLDTRTSFLKIWLPPCLSLSLSLSLPSSPVLAEFPSGVGRLTTYTNLPRLLSPVREGAKGGAPSTI